MPNPGEVYTRLLLPKGHGCPIWCPEHNQSLPDVYRRDGVRIGHVGGIDHDGAFDPLFSICDRPEDPINFEGVPDGFEQLVLGPMDVTCRPRYHNYGSHVCSEPLERNAIVVDTDPATEHNV